VLICIKKVKTASKKSVIAKSKNSSK
jgi:hypothetical protein